MRNIILTIMTALALSFAAAAEFKAGVAVRDVTPNPLLPVSGGAGPSKPSTQQIGDITVRALVLSDDDTTVAIVSGDFLGIPAVHIDKIRALVPDIPGENIMMGATHSHSSADLYGFPNEKGEFNPNFEYMDLVVKKAAEAIQEAYDGRNAATLKINSDEAKGKIAYNYYAPMLFDPRMNVLQAMGKDGKAIATLVNYAIHPEVIGSGQGILSPDLCGPLYDEVEKGGGGTCIFMNGAQGGMVTADNRDMSKPKDNLGHYWDDDRTWEECVRIGGLMASEALRIVGKVEAQENPNLDCWAKTVTFPVESKIMQALIVNSPIQFQRNVDGTSITTQMNLINIGNAQMATLPGEALPNIGFYLKRNMGGEHNFLFGLTNDAFGYILTKEDYNSFDRYKYISFTSLGEQTGTILIDEVLSMAKAAGE